MEFECSDVGDSRWLWMRRPLPDPAGQHHRGGV